MKKLFITAIIFASFLLMFKQSNVVLASFNIWDKLEINTEKIKKDVVSIWPKKVCGEFQTTKNGHTMLSFSCKADYNILLRDKFLDVFFSLGFSFKKETFKFGKKNGIYLYEFEYKVDRLRKYKLYVMLHFRDSNFLWKNPYSRGRISFYVQNLFRMNDLLKWQTFGVPVTYGIAPFRENTEEISLKIKEYKQEIWLSLSLDPMEMSSGLGAVLTVNDALEQERLLPYVSKAIKSLGEVKGFSDRQGSKFVQNIFAMRKLYKILQENKISHILDTRLANKSTAYLTAKLMSFKAYSATLNLTNGCTNFKKKGLWSYIRKQIRAKGSAIIVFEGKDDSCFKFFQKRIKKIPYDFVYLSQLPK